MSEYSHQDINFHNISNIFFFRFNPSEFALKQKILVTALNIIVVKQLFVIYAIFENIFRYKNGELHYIHIAWSKNSNITMVTKIWIKKKKNFCYKIKYTLHIYGLQYLSQYWTFNKNVFPKGDTEHSLDHSLLDQSLFWWKGRWQYINRNLVADFWKFELWNLMATSEMLKHSSLNTKEQYQSNKKIYLKIVFLKFRKIVQMRNSKKIFTFIIPC